MKLRNQVAASVLLPGWVVAQATGPPTALPSIVRDAYTREFREAIPVPVIYNDEHAVDCSGNGHLMTTAYLRSPGGWSTLLQMYMSRDGARVIRQNRSRVMTPVGTFKTLVVIMRYPETIGDGALALWETEQKHINEDHAAFAKSRGYAAPLVVFDNTNLLVAPGEIANPNNPSEVRAAAARHGVSPDDFRFVIVINIDPAKGEGGHAIPPGGDVYMGNYSYWKTPLGARQWQNVARAVYHHEIAHHWGWDHGWSPSCGGTKLGFEPFLAAPVLFGWEDVDGDGVPEILDETPYGRRE